MDSNNNPYDLEEMQLTSNLEAAHHIMEEW